jgi:hypothetical protein
MWIMSAQMIVVFCVALPSWPSSVSCITHAPAHHALSVSLHLIFLKYTTLLIVDYSVQLQQQ